MTNRVPKGPAVLACLALVSGSTGCSWAFVEKKPDHVVAPNVPISCTTSNAAPVLDSICTGYFVLNTALVASRDYGGGAVLLSGGLGLLCALSAGSGFGATRDCRAAKDANALCMTGSEAACRQLNPAWSTRSQRDSDASPEFRPPIRSGVAPAEVWQAPAAGAPAPARLPGCSKDTDCKGERVCEQGTCVEPKPAQ